MARVAILSYENAALFELGCAVEVFGLSRPEIENWYECEVISFNSGPIESTCGVQLSVRRVKNLQQYDLLVVPSWTTLGVEVPAPMAKALRQFHARGKRIVSFCSGAFLLAELGFLNGREATTHWRYAELFQHRFPKVDYAEDVLYLYDGRIGCSAGSSAALDLGIEVIRSDFGHAVANSVARRLVLSAHRKGGQSQFAETPVPKQASQFSNAIDWALANLAKPMDINTFAAAAKMSRRTFDRKFRADFNLTPKAWLTHQRIELAKELLESQTNSIDKIAELAGFENATTMRHHFRKELGVSPNVHRKNFGERSSIVG